MTAALTLSIALTLLLAAALIHYEGLRLTGALVRRLPIRPRQRVLAALLGCLLAHLMEVVLYAAAYAALDAAAFGDIRGEFSGAAVDYLYFSLTSYTTLGIGDVYPVGPIRLIAATEALIGFLLITWSASFSYLLMQRWWHPERDEP
jgi:hypothetical protein